ncbi:Crp/Fnr family transcriptional regulator [Mucilaginibacter sp.]|uniref:Crp/Fnr family transcriptional regulator n=1 Tax=Mucilaginibacter sp. TaxID=1882438 RepID=UPI00260772D4|nr:Crp/Fnr family transcriptional regulator [Mucilaginibacter sp.]MDB5127321.1 Crp/Fnr family transcriptional regulator [Mucilaginibacter sp.]
MYLPFRKYIDEYSGDTMTDDEFALVKAAFTPKKIRKKQYLLQEGDVCKHLSFIIKGAMRQYTVDEKGNEHIVRFGIENWWMADRESFEFSTPTIYYIDALEDTELLQVSLANLTELKQTFPGMNKLTLALDKRGHIAAQKRITAAISLTAEEKYQNLFKIHPIFFQRFPQAMIASYLGISPETLSRIRKNSILK